MILYNDDEVLIRRMIKSDPRVICENEVAQGWTTQTDEKYIMRLHDQANGYSIALVAEYKGEVAGYINVYFDRKTGPFKDSDYPEIVDFGVFEKFRCHGIGGKLMDIAEKLASEKSDTVYLGVGMNSNYGSAQRMYVKRGYVPDGSGVWYKDAPAIPKKSYPNDDDLALYMCKKL